MKLLYLYTSLYRVTVISEGKGREGKGREGNLKWGEDLLNAVKRREIKRDWV